MFRVTRMVAGCSEGLEAVAGVLASVGRADGDVAPRRHAQEVRRPITGEAGVGRKQDRLPARCSVEEVDLGPALGQQVVVAVSVDVARVDLVGVDRDLNDLRDFVGAQGAVPKPATVLQANHRVDLGRRHADVRTADREVTFSRYIHPDEDALEDVVGVVIVVPEAHRDIRASVAVEVRDGERMRVHALIATSEVQLTRMALIGVHARERVDIDAGGVAVDQHHVIAPVTVDVAAVGRVEAEAVLLEAADVDDVHVVCGHQIDIFQVAAAVEDEDCTLLIVVSVEGDVHELQVIDPVAVDIAQA